MLNKIAIGSHTIEIKGVENYTANIVVETGNTKTIAIKSSNNKSIVKNENAKKTKSTSSFKGKAGEFTDLRDNHIYKWILIGSQIWMAENLAYKPISGNYSVYNGDENNVSKFGYLYTWEAAKKIAPHGWHLPTKNDFETMTKFFSTNPVEVYDAVKIGGISGFNALLGGCYPYTKFSNFGVYANFWSATPNDGYGVWVFQCSYYNNPRYDNEASVLDNYSDGHFSVRLIRN